MRLLTATLVGLLLSFAARAVDTHPGYIVLAEGDTVTCTIKGGRFLQRTFYGITVIDEGGKDTFLPSKEKKILGYGFSDGLRTYHYRFVDVGDKLENGFYQLLDNGPKYRLYGRPTTVYGGNPTYVLFNGEAFTKFEPCVVCPWKKGLRELLKDDPEALEAVEKASRVDIPSFVRGLNKS